MKNESVVIEIKIVVVCVVVEVRCKFLAKEQDGTFYGDSKLL
jgi:hypothetical protein